MPISTISKRATAEAGDNSITISEAADMLKKICVTYLEKNKDGKFLIPKNRQRPVFFLGDAGIGKTDIPKQVADDMGLGFVSYSIVQQTRQSICGLPKITAKNYNGDEVLTTEYTASEIVTSVRDEIEKSGRTEGILFIDEANCTSETLAAPMLQLLQNKTLGQCAIPDGWILVLAGNPPEYNKSVKEFDSVTKDRLRIIRVRPDAQSWLKYADDRALNSVVISYISSDNSAIYDFDKESGNILTPRAWEELSLNIDAFERNNFDVTLSLVEQFVAVPSVANSFYDYYVMVKNTITEEEIDLAVQGKASKELITRLKGCRMSIRFMLIACLKKRLHIAADTFSAEDINLMMTNISMFLEKIFGKGAEIEIFMAEILNDNTVVKAAIFSGNNEFGKYIEDVANAEKDIKKRMRRLTAEKKGV